MKKQTTAFILLLAGVILLITTFTFIKLSNDNSVLLTTALTKTKFEDVDHNWALKISEEDTILHLFLEPNDKLQEQLLDDTHFVLHGRYEINNFTSSDTGSNWQDNLMSRIKDDIQGINSRTDGNLSILKLPDNVSERDIFLNSARHSSMISHLAMARFASIVLIMACISGAFLATSNVRAGKEKEANICALFSLGASILLYLNLQFSLSLVVSGSNLYMNFL